MDRSIVNDPAGAEYKLGKVAYDAYCAALGLELSAYEKQTDLIRFGFQQSAVAVFEFLSFAGTFGGQTRNAKET